MACGKVTKMATPAKAFSTAAVDQLGERLRTALTVEDLRLLDQYRREFGADYAVVVAAVTDALALDASGRPAKSTTAIVEKLKRGSMRLSQMQDIAGCRIIVDDTLVQDAVVSRLATMFPSTTIMDRRDRPSHGYRAVHIIVRPKKRPIEIQVRTVMQHRWAELSEKAADTFGIDIKYGGGHKTVREVLDRASETVASFERLEIKREETGDHVAMLRNRFESNLLEFLAVMIEPQ